MAQGVNGKRPKLGRSKIWTPNVIEDIQAKADLGHYQIRGFSTFFNIPTLDQLTFLPAALTRLPLEGYREKCATDVWLGTRFAKKPLHLDIPITIAGMSFGSLSGPAKEALGRGATLAGTSTTTGDGGMTEEEILQDFPELTARRNPDAGRRPRLAVESFLVHNGVNLFGA